MLSNSKNIKEASIRHIVMLIISALLVFIVWRLNSTWSPDMRLWKAFGGASFALLWFTMFIGPVAKLWSWLIRLVSWRRESGIWLAVIALVHGFLILNGWVRWGFLEFFGYQYVAELDTYLRFEPGFGLANLMGLVALIFALLLAATSLNKAVNFLGVSSWKWLHMLAYSIFYLSAIHVVYFAFIHFSPSPYRVIAGLPTEYAVNPLRYFYLGAIVSVFVAQVAAYFKTVRTQRKSDWD